MSDPTTKCAKGTKMHRSIKAMGALMNTTKCSGRAFMRMMAIATHEANFKSKTKAYDNENKNI